MSRIKTFSDVEFFFKSWGMYPSEEDTDDFNTEVIRQGINRACYKQMIEQAEDEHGNSFKEFVGDCIDAQDDAFFLEYETWIDLNEYWEDNGCPGKK